MSVDGSDVFIWTEAVGCGEILTPMLKSFIKHHKFSIHVLGYASDLNNLPQSKTVIPIVLDDNLNCEGFLQIGTTRKEVEEAYTKGHNGTALIWSSIIDRRRESFLIHVDADTILLDDVISPILRKLEEGFGVVGTRRPYRNRSVGASRISRLQHHFRRDAVNTHCFGFRREKLQIPRATLQMMINGSTGNRIKNRLFPVIDFFDRVTFHLARSQGIYYLDSSNQKRHGYHHRNSPFESSMISFSAVGSGYSFFYGNSNATSPSYRDFAISSYALYAKYLLDREIGVEPMKSEYLIGLLGRLDQSSWTLREKA